MTRFIDNVTPLNAENLNGLVDEIADGKEKADKALEKGEDAIDNANLIHGIFIEFVDIFGNPITAQEFDNSNITAQGFDNKSLTATQFDSIGKTLLI